MYDCCIRIWTSCFKYFYIQHVSFSVCLKVYYFGYWYFQALSLSRTRGLKSPNSYEIAYDKYRESLSCPHPPMQDNIVYRRSHRLAIWRYEKWPYRPTLAGMTKNLYHGVFQNFTGFLGIWRYFFYFFFHAWLGVNHIFYWLREEILQ